MKLVGDSKLIAEAYQKIYEDDFMSGIGEYEKMHETIYSACFDGELPESCGIDKFTFKDLWETASNDGNGPCSPGYGQDEGWDQDPVELPELDTLLSSSGFEINGYTSVIFFHRSEAKCKEWLKEKIRQYGGEVDDDFMVGIESYELIHKFLNETPLFYVGMSGDIEQMVISDYVEQNFEDIPGIKPVFKHRPNTPEISALQAAKIINEEHDYVTMYVDEAVEAYIASNKDVLIPLSKWFKQKWDKLK